MNFDEEAMKIRRGKHGIIETIPREVLKTHDDLSILYTPGVAQPCREITKDPDLSFDLTCRGNMIADLITIGGTVDYVVPDIDR